MPKHLLWIVPIVASVATGLAALPYGDGFDTCFWSSWAAKHDFDQDIRMVHHFVPYDSLSCERDGFAMQAGTALDAALWMLVAMLIVPAFALRRFATARTAGEALLVLGIFGLASTQESWEVGAFLALILTPLPLLAAERLSGCAWGNSVLVALALPFAAIIGWSPGFLAGLSTAAVAGGVLASVLVAVVIRRVDPLWFALPPRDLFLRRETELQARRRFRCVAQGSKPSRATPLLHATRQTSRGAGSPAPRSLTAGMRSVGERRLATPLGDRQRGSDRAIARTRWPPTVTTARSGRPAQGPD